MTNPYLNKPAIPKSTKKGCLIACATVAGVILLTVLTLLYFVFLHDYELCTAEIGGNVVRVCQKGYFPMESHAVKIELNGKILMESDCEGDLGGMPTFTIEAIDENTAAITGYGDDFTTVIHLVPEGDSQYGKWWLEEPGEGYSIKWNEAYNDSVRAVAKSLTLSHSKPD